MSVSQHDIIHIEQIPTDDTTEVDQDVFVNHVHIPIPAVLPSVNTDECRFSLWLIRSVLNLACIQKAKSAHEVQVKVQWCIPSAPADQIISNPEVPN